MSQHQKLKRLSRPNNDLQMLICSCADPSFAIHPRNQGMRVGYTEIGRKMIVKKQLVRWLPVVLMACIVSVPMATTHSHSASSCSALKKEFSTKIRPSILRLAKKEFHLSNWYHATLNKQQSGAHPTLADMDATHEAMIAKCNTRSDKASCIKFANQMTAASRRIFDVNKRWSAAGCPGQLNK